MIKRTVYFGNPVHLSTESEQLRIYKKETEELSSVPIEDIGFVILDHPQVTITYSVISKLLAVNAAIISCNEKHMPVGLTLPLDGHTRQTRIFQNQISASEPLKKQLWKSTVEQKIRNQARILEIQNKNHLYLYDLAKKVKSGDQSNMEAQAASFYWKSIFMEWGKFSRDPEGEMPNGLLNYGYAILRALVARSLVGSGLLPTLGIFHRNQYNAYCLADDIMEPYRPLVDHMIYGLLEIHGRKIELNRDIKRELLTLPTCDVILDGRRSPLMIAVQRTTSSLARSFDMGENHIQYAEIP